jgi:hypothetical protein
MYVSQMQDLYITDMVLWIKKIYNINTKSNLQKQKQKS